MRRLGEFRHPEISLHSFSLSEHLDITADRREKWAALIKASAEKLRASGADFMICPSNTPHDIYDDIASEMPIPWLHIVQPVRQAAESLRLKAVLLLGTRFTLESDFYDRRLLNAGIALVRPDLVEMARIHDIINKELIRGKVMDASQHFLSQMLLRYASGGVDGVILGCTELPMIISPSMTSLPLLDSATLLAEAAIDYAVATSSR